MPTLCFIPAAAKAILTCCHVIVSSTFLLAAVSRTYLLLWIYRRRPFQMLQLQHSLRQQLASFWAAHAVLVVSWALACVEAIPVLVLVLMECRWIHAFIYQWVLVHQGATCREGSSSDKHGNV